MKSYLCTWAVAAVVLSGCGAKTELAPQKPVVGNSARPQDLQAFESPEATFQTAKDALERGDYRAFCDCWTDEGLGWLTGGMAMTVNMFRLMSEKESQDGGVPDDVTKATQRTKRLTQLLIKHGFTGGVVPELNIVAGDNAPKPVQQQVREQLNQISSVIADKANFFAEFLEIVEEVSDLPMDTLLPSGSTLSELKIDGDSATGVILKPTEDQVRECPATFSKVNGEWKFDEITGLAG